MNKIKVLMLGSEVTVKGGMTSVVLSFLNNKFENAEIKFFPTHYNCNNMKKIFKYTIRIFPLTNEIKKSDIIHMHMSERGSFIRKYIAFKISKRFNKKVIVHMHGAEFKEYYENANNLIKKRIVNLLLNSDYVITLGKNWNDYVKKINPQINSFILKNAVEVNDTKVSYINNEFNILFLAIIDKRKGIYDLVDAAKIILNNYSGDKKIKFIIAGSGKEENKIKKAVEESGMNNYFEFTGWITGDEKIKLLKKSQLFVLPSYNEGLPISILEAISYGLPVISTNVGSINEAIKNDINGYMLNPGDIIGLVEKIEELVDNYDKWYKLSRNSKRIALEEFDLKKYFKQMDDIYLSLVDNGLEIGE